MFVVATVPSFAFATMFFELDANVCAAFMNVATDFFVFAFELPSKIWARAHPFVIVVAVLWSTPAMIQSMRRQHVMRTFVKLSVMVEIFLVITIPSFAFATMIFELGAVGFFTAFMNVTT